jgi:hypothetical protein
MNATADHNAVLKRVARERLGQLGIVQKGRSRIWFDDRMWFMTMVEFQPSSYSRGSYLNVGARWLWWPGKDALAFDYGYRVHGFESSDTGDWEATSRALADRAAERCLELRAKFPHVSAAASILNAGTPTDWDAANAGIAAALAGDIAMARRRLAAVVVGEARYDWEIERRGVATRLLEELDEAARFRNARISDIQGARMTLRLPDLDDGAIRKALEPQDDQGEPDRRFATRLRGFLSRD